MTSHPFCREVKCRCLDLGTGDEHARIATERVHCAHDGIVSRETPVLRPAELVEQLDAVLPPDCVTLEAEPLEDDLVHLVAEEQLRQRELLLPGSARYRVVADGEENAPRHRLLVILDLALEVERVLVFERSRRPKGHSGRGLETDLS
jgi:hypothetical protein